MPPKSARQWPQPIRLRRVRSSRRAPPAPAPAPPPPAVSARRIRGPSESLKMRGCRSRMARSSSANPPSGPIRTSIPPAAVALALQRLQRIGGVRGLVAEHQQALRLAPAQIAIERHRLGDLGDAQDAALLGGLDDIGAHPLAVDPGDLGEAGQNRLQARTRPSRPPSAPCSRAGHVSAAQTRKRGRAGDPAAGSGRRWSRLSGRLRPAIDACHSPSRPLNTRMVSPAASRSTLPR